MMRGVSAEYKATCLPECAFRGCTLYVFFDRDGQHYTHADADGHDEQALSLPWAEMVPNPQDILALQEWTRRLHLDKS